MDSMNDWKEVSLASTMDIIGGGTPKTNIKEYWDGDIPWLSVVDFNHGLKYVTATEKSISEKGLRESSTKYLESGDIIISARGTVGALAVLSRPMTFNQSCYGLKAKKDICDNHFLYYLLKDSIREIGNHTYGAVFDTITKETFNNIQVFLPTLSEQQSIAEVLSSLDDKIDLLQRQNKTLEQMAETLFRRWLLDFDRTTTLAEYIKVQSGYAFKSKDFLETGTFGIVKITNISFDSIDIENTQFVSESLALSINDKFYIKPGSFLIAMTGAEIGKIGIVGINTKNLLLNQRVGMLVDKLEHSSVIGYMFLKSKEGQDHIINTASGSAQPNISTSGIEEMEVPFKSESEQVKIIDQLSPLFEKKKRNLFSIKLLRDIRDLLLPKLMIGAIHVNNG